MAPSGATFELMPNEVLALLGENGAGESTCVRLLGGVHQPALGDGHIKGQAVPLRWWRRRSTS
ncbi:ATP-binding cassette domain-containing protein [Variovorax sp. 770b2]|uniref:ATP-binding cassette domain-containing protein n=1 Tax=Variovorax sp. 770b2 TaxID=1566271 RepID=UPI002737EAD2|nr:ATP-binding cassette domain-containing protein [Variovorax sp. 770b2]